MFQRWHPFKVTVNEMKQCNTLSDTIRSTFTSTFNLLLSKLSKTEIPIEKNFDKNEILWLRSFLNLPAGNGFAKILVGENSLVIVQEELEALMKVDLSII